MCDDKGPTIVLIKTTAGHTFGGFTHVSWDSSDTWKKDTESFVFSVDLESKYPIVVPDMAIGCYAAYGPAFGKHDGGHDISLEGNSNKTFENSVYPNRSYNVPAAQNGKSVFTDGDENF